MLPILEKEFAVSPAHFELQGDVALTNELDQLIGIFCGHSNNEGHAQKRSVTKLCIATVLHHWPFLLTKLHSTNRLWANQTLQRVSRELKERAVVRYHWDATSETPAFTGLPRHVLIFIEFYKLEKNHNDILEAIRETPARTTEVTTDHLDN